MIKNNKGIVLAYVLVIMAVMSILGFVFIHISLTETLHTARDKSKMQAYYLAKSGVEATVSWMLNTANDGKSLIGRTSDPVELAGSNINGTYIVTVIGNVTSPILLVKGTGTVNGVSNTATMSINTGVFEGAVFKDMIYASTIVTLKGTVDVYGDVSAGIKVDLNGGAKVLGIINYPSVRDYPAIVFPANPSTFGDGSFNNAILDIGADSDEMMVYNLFSSNGDLTIKTGGKVVTLVVDKLDIKGALIIDGGIKEDETDGGGRLRLFVKTKADLQVVKMNYDLNPRNLFIFMGVGSGLSFSGNTFINSLIYAPDANISSSGNANFTGFEIAGTVDMVGCSFLPNKFGSFDDIGIDDLPVVTYEKGSWVNN